MATVIYNGFERADAYEAIATARASLQGSVVRSGAYALKLAWSGESYGAEARGRRRDVAVGGLATLYGLWLVYAAGLHYLLMCAMLFAPGILVYQRARRERGERVFTALEAAIAFALVALAVLAVVLIATGRLSPL